MDSIANNPRVARVRERFERLSEGLHESSQRARYGMRINSQMIAALQDRFGPVDAVTMTMKVNKIAKEIRRELAADSDTEAKADFDKMREFSVPLALFEVVADSLGDAGAYDFVRDTLGAGL